MTVKHSSPPRERLIFGAPRVYNRDRDEVGVGHLSLFGDEVTLKGQVRQGDWSAFSYLEAVRVEEKAEEGEYDDSDF